MDIEKEWLIRLMELAEFVRRGQDDKDEWTNHLIGYIESAQSILDAEERKSKICQIIIAL